MVNYPRWAMILTIVVALLGVIYASPNFLLTSEESEQATGVLPSKQMNLGLDLQGGSSLLLNVEVDVAIKELMESVETTVRRELRRSGDRIGYTGLRTQQNAVLFDLRNITDSDKVRDRLRNIENGFELTDTGGGKFRLEMPQIVPAFGQAHGHLAYDSEDFKTVFLRPVMASSSDTTLHADFVLLPV